MAKIPPGQLMTTAKPFRVQHKAPCSDCPWARKSLKGWTGPNSSKTWLATARDYWHPIACHTRRIAAGIVHRLGGVMNGHWECAGAAIFRANTNVHYYGDNRPLLRLDPNRITVFSSPGEFLNHHGEGLPDQRSEFMEGEGR